VVDAIGSEENSDNLSMGINGRRRGIRTARRLNSGVVAVTVNEAMVLPTIVVQPCDLSGVVDAEGDGPNSTWKVEDSIGSIAIDETLPVASFSRLEFTYNLPSVALIPWTWV
jgi:hypothetical protein